jgi:hypothetical protein
LLELLKDNVALKGGKGRKMQMWHLSYNVFSVPVGTEWVFTAPVVSCNRHFIPNHQRSYFIEKFTEVKGVLEEITKLYGVVGGWIFEKEDEEREEWVLFSGFGSVDNRMAFARTDEFERYRKTIGYVSSFEVKHLNAIRDF